jgi:hypothetical protein
VDLTFTLLRPRDLLSLTVHAINLRLDTQDPSHPRLVRDPPGQPAILVFGVGPQSITERAYFETSALDPPAPAPPPTVPPLPPGPGLPGSSDAPQPPGATPIRMSGPSRLAFQLPNDLHDIPYSIAGLLDWSRLTLILPPAGSVPAGASNLPGQSPPAIAEPGPDETALELPYRLVLSPNVSPHGVPAWVHAESPVEHEGWAELWHTRLGVRPRSGAKPAVREASPQFELPLRAVWSADFVQAGPLPPHSEDDTPFRSAMSARDRDQIVILTSGFAGYRLSEPDGSFITYVPQPVSAERLMLSALGGWLSSRGSWLYPVSYTFLRPFLSAPPRRAQVVVPTAVAALDLVEWDHVATQGRDHYVRIVYEGFLYPFGHRATLVKVTERKVLAPEGAAGNPDTSPVAYMRQRMYIVVRERDKEYTTAPFQFAGREMPLRDRVRIKLHVTPEIDPPVFIGDSSFRITVGGQPFQFPLVGRDATGADIDFLAPLIFVSLSETQLQTVVDAYATDDTLRRCVVRGRNIAYADPAAGDTNLKTTALYFTSEVTTAAPPYTDAPFLPSLDTAAVTAPALTALMGQNTSVPIQLYPPYLQHGIDPHGGVFAQIVGAPPPVGFSADKSGGFSRPNISLTAFSARKGLVSGHPDDAANGLIDPAAYFGDIDAKLFGTIDLGQLIPLDQITHRADAAQNAPEIRTRAIPNRRHPTQLVTLLNWEPQLQDFSEPPITIAFNSDGQTSALRLHVRLEDHLDGTPPASVAHGRLSNFELRLFGVIGLKIASITFDSSNGAKSTVALQLAAQHPIGFEGPLQFIQTLAEILPPGLFGGSGPSIALTPTALRVTYTIGLPPIPCGVFSLEHISILAGLDLPYLDGKPAVEFGFASRGRPFLVTVEIFGGGGFVHVVLDADGIRMVEGSIEFGGNFSFDVGVASGGVHAMAGIYFQLKGSSSDLTGFVDIGGEVSVLGIISISIDLNLSLSWQHSPSGNVIQGRATLTVSVHVLFFSASVQISVERSFSAGGGDPRIDQLMSPTQWAQYAGAFA